MTWAILSSGMVNSTDMGCELGHHHDAVGLARLHDIADIDQMNAGAARHRRDDVGIAQIDAGGFDIGLVGHHDAFGGAAPVAAWVATCCWEMAFCASSA